MAQNFANTIKGDLRPIGNRVLVSDMYFGEQQTKGGIILTNDNGKTRGIYPRWGKVYAKGPDNKDDYEVGQWVLVEHGRWTRGVELENEKGIYEVRMVEAESILAYADEKPNDTYIGKEFDDGPVNIDPASFNTLDMG
jgi:co-chaperonin GroES (HSP10)